MPSRSRRRPRRSRRSNIAAGRPSPSTPWSASRGVAVVDEPFGALDALTRLKMHALLRDLCRHHRPAVLLVTHDVDEAIVLADRVAVLDHGRVVVDRRVALAHPRDRTDPRFADIRGELLAALGVTAAA